MDLTKKDPSRGGTRVVREQDEVFKDRTAEYIACSQVFAAAAERVEFQAHCDTLSWTSPCVHVMDAVGQLWEQPESQEVRHLPTRLAENNAKICLSVSRTCCG
jgi:hypothetical protein